MDVFGPLVVHWCQKKGLSSEDTSDVFQEVFKSVLTGIKNFKKGKETDTFIGWLRTVTKSRIKDHWKKNNKQPHAKGGSEQQAYLAEQPFDALSSNSDSDTRTTIRLMLEFAKDKINETHWKVFLQLAVEQKAPEDVAKAFGITRANVYNINARVKKRLREEFSYDETSNETTDASETS